MSLVTLTELEQKIHSQKLAYEKWCEEKFDRDNAKILQMAMQVVDLVEEAMTIGSYREDYVKVCIPVELATVEVLDILSRYYHLQSRSLGKDTTWFVNFK